MRRRSLFAAALVPAAVPAWTRAQPQPLRLGLAPYLSPAALLAAFRPVGEQLQKSLGQPVETYTARDFRALAAAVQAAEYDIALLPAHLARVAAADWGWQPLAGTIEATPVVVLVRAGGPVRSAPDLCGKAVGALDLMSLTAAVGARWLAEQGQPEIAPGRPKAPPPERDQREACVMNTLTVMPSINSALFALERDELVAVVAAASQLQGLPPGTPGGQRTLARIEQIPGPVYAARPGPDAATLARWRAALLSLVPDPARPRMASNTRPQALGLSDLDSMEPYAAYLRRQLAAR